MSEGFEIKINAEAQAVIARLGNAPDMLRSMARAMDKENLLTIAHISSVRMRGNDGKPFPVELHVLGIRSGRYYKSLRASKASVGSGTVDSAIGSNVKYAGIHEFGGTIKVGERKGTVRLRTDRSGALMRQRGYEHLAVFARGSHKRAKEVSYTVAAHEIKMPARRPVQSGIEDRAAKYGESVSQGIIEFWKGLN